MLLEPTGTLSTGDYARDTPTASSPRRESTSGRHEIAAKRIDESQGRRSEPVETPSVPVDGQVWLLIGRTMVVTAVR